MAPVPTAVLALGRKGTMTEIRPLACSCVAGTTTTLP